MSKTTISLRVMLTFTDPITKDAELAHVTKQVLSALKHEVEAGEGLAPEDNLTDKIEVSDGVNDLSVSF